MPLSTVVAVSPRAGGGYDVRVRPSGARGKRTERTLTADQVIFAASALGTPEAAPSDARVRCAASALGATGGIGAHQLRIDPGSDHPDTSIDFSHGVAITSSFHPDEHTHIEPVRYGKGSNLMALLQTVLTDGDGPEPRWRTWMREMWSQRRLFRDIYDLGDTGPSGR